MLYNPFQHECPGDKVMDLEKNYIKFLDKVKEANCNSGELHCPVTALIICISFKSYTTVNPLYTDIQCSEKICYNDN